MNSCNGCQCNAVYRRIKKCSINFTSGGNNSILSLWRRVFHRSTSLDKFSRVALWKEKSHSWQNENVFNLPPITMLGTSTAAGNSARKVKLVLFSHLFSSRYFPRWRKLVAKVQGTRENRYFSRLSLLFPLSYQTTAPTVHSEVLELL